MPPRSEHRNSIRNEPSSPGPGRLDGVWRVERIGGPLPLVGVTKRIFGEYGWTLVAGVPVGPFRVRRPTGERATLEYVAAPVRDELEAGGPFEWEGRSYVAGREVSRFRLVRADAE
jgi:hypothetical protein